ncbi:testis-expressed protein 2-like [Aplochiton taeniatus]
MEDSELIFLDRHHEGPSVAFSKDKAGARDNRPDPSLELDLGPGLGQGLRSQTFHMPLSPSSPSSLVDLSALSADLLSSSSLVKSSSTELEPRETGSWKPKPLLNLVKSTSTEISRRGQPEVNLSKSDSKLHMPPWKQLTQHSKGQEARAGAGGAGWDDACPSPPSPGSLSPTEPRGSSLIAELEDTRRKFSEAMQDPMSMLSKIMGDESSGSPKQGKGAGAGDSPGPQGNCGREGSWTPVSNDDGALETPSRSWRRTDSDQRSVCDTPVKRRRRGPAKGADPATPHPRGRDSCYEICTYGDVMQVVEVQGDSGGAGPRRGLRQGRVQSRGLVPGAAVPFRWLFFVGLLAYGFLVLPLPPYVTGLSVGLACGFLLGLVVVFMFTPPRRSVSAPWGVQGARLVEPHSLATDPLSREHRETKVLEGWMNELNVYDPETFQPSLTHSVYATLEGSRLRLAYPRGNIPRRAAFHEPPHEAVFLCSRTYQLAKSKVSLLPAALARKRMWNMKYPVCILLAEGEVAEEESLLEGQEEEEKADGKTLPAVQTELPVTLYLFGRTGREKEEWFQHFKAASRAEHNGALATDDSKAEGICRGDPTKGSTEDLRDLPGTVKERLLLDYGSYMARLIGSESESPTPTPSHSEQGSPTARRRIPSDEAESGSDPVSGAEGGAVNGLPAWVNALVGRIFWDFLREKYWSDQVAHKLQKKLSKIRLPYFMNELTLADLDMGTCMPQVISTSKPSLDHKGLWLEMEVMYTGCLQMTLETKMNLCKLGKESLTEADSIPETRQVGFRTRHCILADSDEESSSAGSSDEEEAPPTEPQGVQGEKGTPPVAEGHTGGSTGRKFLRFVDKIAKSKYFQKATENEYIKKKIAEVSNMPLMLTVEVLELSGTLAVNIPPPPTDRIWYSFRLPPRLDLRVRPMLGEREVTFTHVTEWIERKLQCEFQKVFVMPNMDDLYLPLMTSSLDNPPPSHPSHPSPVQSSSRQSSVESQEYLTE